MTLAAIFHVHPQLPLDKLKVALFAIKTILRYGSFEIASNACQRFADLCDGNKAVIVEHDDLDYVIEQLIILIESRKRGNVINALEALGSIVRWGSDDVQCLLQNHEFVPSNPFSNTYLDLTIGLMPHFQGGHIF